MTATTPTRIQRRRIMVCACCKRTKTHRAHSLCGNCYVRWIRHGRPADGPPQPHTTPRTPRPPKPCQTDGCPREHHAHGLCETCYYRERNAGRLQLPPGTRMCSNDWCDRPHMARGFCKRCYQRAVKAGDWTRATKILGRYAVERADVDPIAMQRLVDGDPPERTTLGEREAAVRALHALGMTDRQIAERMRWPRAQPMRKRLGLSPNRGTT